MLVSSREYQLSVTVGGGGYSDIQIVNFNCITLFLKFTEVCFKVTALFDLATCTQICGCKACHTVSYNKTIFSPSFFDPKSQRS
jgi:hypothetical protein